MLPMGPMLYCPEGRDTAAWPNPLKMRPVFAQEITNSPHGLILFDGVCVL
jgi:hypothetical protein